jgi:prepilin-type N-terminal cleavage/methylation domain-containing protein
MITTTGHSDRQHQTRKGFTLLELLVAMGISSMLLIGIFSSAIFISRSSLATTDYAGMDSEARIALEVFAREVRMASNVSSFSSDSVTLTVQNGGTSYDVTYTYVPGIKAFYRAYGTADQQLLVSGITNFQFSRYTLLHTPATNDLETKQLQLELRSIRSGPAKSFTSNNVVSARYVLRNKIVSN